MSTINANATVTLTVNGKQAEQMLTSLKSRAEQLEKSITKAAQSGNKADLKKFQKELRQTQSQIRQIESATQGVEDTLRHLDESSPRELQRTLNTLRRQLNGIERGSDAWKAQTAKIRQVRAELDKLNAELRESEGFWTRFNRKLNDWQTAIAGAAAAVTGLIMAGRSAVSAYADMDAEMANVRKFTGMAAQQVEELNEDFKQIDTRTSREDLNKLAQEAGRLGKTSQEDVMGFVRAADQINVALDDLGDGATLTLSKLTNIFGDEKKYGTEESLLKVGSVINELSQNCTASAPYLAEFTKRMAGVGAQAQMSIPQIMGFAAVLDSQGQAVEMSATALSKLIMDMFKQKDKVLAATKMDADKFNAELKKSTNDGLMYLLETLSKMGNIDVLAPVFKDMGENGARAAQVISALAANLDTVKWEQQEAQKAFEEGISVTNEFNVQNTTVQAGLDKARKGVTEMAVELGQKLQPVMSHVISSTTLLLKVMSTVITFISEHKAAILTTTAAIIAYNVAINANNILFRLHYALVVVTTTATKAYHAVLGMMKAAYIAMSYAVAKLNGNYTRAQALQVLMRRSATQLRTVYALVAAAIVAAAAALAAYIKSQDTEAKVQKTLNGIKSEAAKKVIEEKQSIDLLIKAMNNENLSMKDRQTAAEKLNKLIPGYNAHLDNTRKRYVANKEKLDEYIKSLAKMYEVMGAKDKLIELGKEKAEVHLQTVEYEKQLKAAEANSANGVTYTTSYGVVGNTAQDLTTHVRTKLNSSKTKENQIDAQISAITDVYGADLQKQEVKQPPKADEPTKSDFTYTPTDTTKSGSTKTEDKFKAEKEWKEREEALNRIAYATGKKDYEAYTKAMTQIEIDYQQKIRDRKDLTQSERLEADASYYEALKKQGEEADKFTAEEETKRYEEQLANEKQRYADGEVDKKTYDDALELMELEHLRRMATVYKEGTKEYTDAQAAYLDKLVEDQKQKQKEAEEAAKEHQKHLDDIKKEYFGDNATEQLTNYNNDLAALEEVYQLELKATKGNEAEKLRITEAYEKAKLALRKKYAQESDETDKNFLQQWNEDITEWLDGDLGQAVQQSFDVITSGMSSIFQQMTSLIQAETEIQTAAINKRYEREISNAEGNNYKVKKLEAERDKELAKTKREANRKQFKMQVLQAVAQTAQNALAAYGSAAAIPLVGYILAPIAAAMAVAAGAIQIASIKKQQQASEAQGYSEGGFTPPGAKDKEVGVVHAGEWVASQKLLQSPVARPMIEALDYAQRTNTIGSLKASDVGRQISAPMYQAEKVSTPIIIEQSSQPMMEQMIKNTEALNGYKETMKKLNRRLDEPFVTVNTVIGDTGIQQAEEEYERLMRNKTPKSRRKK